MAYDYDMLTRREHEGWDLLEHDIPGAEHRALILPGALASAAVYRDLLAEPTLTEASIGMVAATLPGFGRTLPPEDLSVENYARMATQLAADLGADVVMGHSYGANVAIEMAAAGYTGPLILVSPSFSRHDESRVPRALDRLSTVSGDLPFTAALKIIGQAISGKMTRDQHDAMVAELKNNDPHFVRKNTRLYLDYLDHYGSVVPRLCSSAARAWVVFAEHDDIRLGKDEKARLGGCPGITLLTVPGATHMSPVEKPAWFADLIVQALAADAGRNERMTEVAGL